MATNNAINIGVVAGGGNTYTFPAATGTLLSDNEIGTSIQAYSANLDEYAAVNPSANVVALLGAADYAAMRTQLGLVIGTNVQAYDAELAAIAGLTSAADRGIYFTGSGTASLFTLTSAARTVLDDTSVAAMATTLGLGTGSSPQFTAVNIGHATDTTLARSAAGQLTIEGVQIATISNAVTLTNKRPQPRTASSTTAATLTPDLSSANVYFRTTQTEALTINAPTGTPVIGETIAIYVDSAGAQTLTMNATYIPFGAAFPATTTAGKTLMITAQWNGSVWRTLWATQV